MTLSGRVTNLGLLVASITMLAGCGGDHSGQTGLPAPGTTAPVTGPTAGVPMTAPTAPGAAPQTTGTAPTGTVPAGPTAAPTGGVPPTTQPTSMPTAGMTGPVTVPTTMPTGTTAPTTMPTTTTPPPPTVVCGDTKGKYDGDEYCILPPPPDQGFQLHYGPANYDDPNEVAKYIINPGQEDNIFVPETSGNTKQVYYFKRQYRMRPGSHHMIITEGSTSNPFAGGKRLGGSQNESRDNPQGTPPPENQGIGMLMAANDPITLNLHHFNDSDHPRLKEAWVNFWYVDPSMVTQTANELYLFAAGTSVPPGGHTVFTGKKPITAKARILSMYGHRHASTVRFTAYLTHAGTKKPIYQDFNWEEPGVYEFNSTTMNPPADPTTKVGGAASGDMPIDVGDELDWECEVQNTSSMTITYGQNEALNSEMCILIGDVIGDAIIQFF